MSWLYRPDDEATSRRKALQNIVAGQQAENLLDFDDPDEKDGQLSGLAATTISTTPATAASIIQNSSNPLDDLVSIFGGTNLGGTSSPPPPFQPAGLGFSSLSPTPTVTQPSSAQDDLLGLF